MQFSQGVPFLLLWAFTGSLEVAGCGLGPSEIGKDAALRLCSRGAVGRGATKLCGMRGQQTNPIVSI